MKKRFRHIRDEYTDMRFESFIAKRIYFSTNRDKKATPPVIRLAISGVALGLAIMILAVSIVIGFKKEIREKIIGFGSHIQITAFDSNTSYETRPIGVSDSLLTVLKSFPEITHAECFATKPGVIKTDDNFLGIALKGVGSDYDWNFFRDNLTEGSLPSYSDSVTSNEILISRYIADKLHLKTGDDIFSYFVQDNVRARKFHITGIYQTNFTEYDKLFVIGDVRHIQKLNGWSPDQYSGIELMTNDYDQLDKTVETLYFSLIDQTDKYGESFFVQSVKDMNPQIFSWLDLLDLNVWVILILMSIVAGFTMVSGLLIIILERTNMIGILKAMGAPNLSIRKIFLYVAFFLIGKGMIWGNIAGLSLCLLQYYFRIVKLNPDIYYITAVPIDLNLFYVVLLNAGTLLISLFMMLAPSYLVSLIRPAKSIKFE